MKRQESLPSKIKVVCHDHFGIEGADEYFAS